MPIAGKSELPRVLHIYHLSLYDLYFVHFLFTFDSILAFPAGICPINAKPAVRDK